MTQTLKSVPTQRPTPQTSTQKTRPENIIFLNGYFLRQILISLTPLLWGKMHHILTLAVPRKKLVNNGSACFCYPYFTYTYLTTSVSCCQFHHHFTSGFLYDSFAYSFFVLTIIGLYFVA